MKKKGFTLIELLAVIVILAIIALIATPLVLKYIEKSRKGAFKNSIESIERVAELKVIDMQTKGMIEYPLELDVKDLDLKNKEKLNGTVTVEKDANNKYTYTYDITDNEYKIYGTKDSEVYKLDKTVKLKLKTANGIIDDENNIVYSFYDSGEYFAEYREIGLENYFEAENGTLEFQKSPIFNTDSTGSKIILKDNNNKVVKVYTVIIFGDVNNDGWIDSADESDVWSHTSGSYNKLDKYGLIAADINNDGVVNEEDRETIVKYEGGVCYCNQITRVCNCLED